MVFGFALFVFGYALFYWGWHHMPGQCRYSLWALLGFGTLFGPALPPGQPIFANGGSSGGGGGTGGGTGGGGSGGGTAPAPAPAAGSQGSKGRSPVGAGMRLTRTDQGVDWTGAGPLYAVGAGTITQVYANTPTGWPGGVFIVLKLDNPPAGIPSPDIYYAENISPNVKVGQHVSAGQVIGTATGKYNPAGTGIEIGFASPTVPGTALGWQWGQAFKNWIGA